MQFLQRKKDEMQNCLQRAASDFTSSSRVANTDETRGVLSSVLVDIGIVVYRAGAGFPESYDRGYRAMLVYIEVTGQCWYIEELRANKAFTPD